MNQDTSGPAFPANFYADSQTLHPFSGLTKREWFAGMALQGLLSSNANIQNSLTEDEKKMTLGQICALRCFIYADAMIEESKKEKA